MKSPALLDDHLMSVINEFYQLKLPVISRFPWIYITLNKYAKLDDNRLIFQPYGRVSLPFAPADATRYEIGATMDEKLARKNLNPDGNRSCELISEATEMVRPILESS